MKDIFNKETYAEMVNYLDEIECKALQLVKEYAKLTRNSHNKTSAKYVNEITSFDEDSVTLEGDEYWRYSGHEHHIITMPIDFVLSEDFRKEFFQEAVKQAKQALKSNREKRKKLKAKEKQRKISTYNRLKKELEG